MCDISSSAAVLLTAFALDIAAGDPVYPLHPVRLIGRLISLTENLLRKCRFTGLSGGIILTAAVIAISAGCFIILHSLLENIHHWAALAFDVFVVYSCLAIGDLVRHGRPVADALDRNDLQASRTAVSKLVGRDVNVLDAHGVARACVESIAESFLDGFFAPVFWYSAGTLAASVLQLDCEIFGISLMVIYKAVNTLDSMVGYRNDRYIFFGRASARVDDALNFIPARLAIPVMAIASIMSRKDTMSGLRIAWRDRLKHESPNSAHTESFAAGALGLKLGGPTLYNDGAVEKAWLGDGTADAAAYHIREVSTLILISGVVTLIFSVILMTI